MKKIIFKSGKEADLGVIEVTDQNVESIIQKLNQSFKSDFFYDGNSFIEGAITIIDTGKSMYRSSTSINIIKLELESENKKYNYNALLHQFSIESERDNNKINALGNQNLEFLLQTIIQNEIESFEESSTLISNNVSNLSNKMDVLIDKQASEIGKGSILIIILFQFITLAALVFAINLLLEL